MGEFITGGEGDFFVQTERSQPFAHLTCVGVGDLPLPLGDLTAVYCPNPASKGKFIVAGYIQGEPGMGTTTLTRPLSTVANWLLENDCGFEAFVTYACRGTRALPSNYDIGAVLFGAQPTNSTLVAAVAQQPAEDGRINTTVEISYADRRLIYVLAMQRQALVNTTAANAIAFLPKACESRCGPARGLCQEGFMAMDALGAGAYNAEIKYTVDGGANWVITDGDPFYYGIGDVSDILVIETASGHRVIAAQGSAQAGEYAEISYSEDYGANWTSVWVGTTVNQTIQALCHYGGKLWAAASGGYIYGSSDIGDTWVAQESGVEAPGITLNDIVMYSLQIGYCVGDTNTFLYTTNGTEWNTRAGPSATNANLLSVAVNDKGHVFVGAADGNLYVSEDGGLTWATRHSFGAGTVDWVAFDEIHRYFGALVWNDGGTDVGTMYRSIDGGASWSVPAGQAGAWNSILNGGYICDQNNIFVVGETHEGTTLVAKASPTGE